MSRGARRGCACRAAVRVVVWLGGALAAVTGCSKGPLPAIDLPADALTDGLVAHYTFDDGSGTVVADHSGNKRDGVLVGGTWIADGKFGGALHLDGTGYVEVDNFPDAPPDFTVSAWARTAAWADADLETIASTESVFDGGWQVNLQNLPDAAIGFQSAYWDQVLDLYTFSDCACVQAGVWTHLAFVVDGGAHTMTVYADGRVASVVGAPDPIAPGAPRLYIGRWSLSGRLLVGDVDDIAIYARALGPAEVVALETQPPPDVE